MATASPLAKTTFQDTTFVAALEKFLAALARAEAAVGTVGGTTVAGRGFQRTILFYHTIASVRSWTADADYAIVGIQSNDQGMMLSTNGIQNASTFGSVAFTNTDLTLIYGGAGTSAILALGLRYFLKAGTVLYSSASAGSAKVYVFLERLS